MKIFKKSIMSLMCLLFFLATIVTGCNTNNQSLDSNKKQVIEQQTNSTQNKDNKDEAAQKETTKASNTENTSNSNSQSDTGNNTITSLSGIEIHFIDVGQADSIYVTADGEAMLIDAGNNGDADTVVNYVKNQNMLKLSYLIGTHPHEDHLGGMDVVIKSFDIGAIYMPKATATTKTYEDVLNAIKSKGLKINSPTPGTTFKLGNAECTILAPNGTGYEDANNYSVVVKIQYGDTSFLLTGDAEDLSENEIINKGYDIKADVLKLGHHGSSSSTSSKFLDKVNPKYAVISVGKGNDYGHPTQETMDKLKSKGIPVYRTDENGTIIVKSDGKKISFNTKPGTYSYASAGTKQNTSSTTTTTKPSTQTTSKQTNTVTNNKQSVTVYITRTGEKYHMDGCQYLSKSKIPISLDDARSSGYGPCSKCKPPQ